jgi:molecular chaperone GrpE
MKSEKEVETEASGGEDMRIRKESEGQVAAEADEIEEELKAGHKSHGHSKRKEISRLKKEIGEFEKKLKEKETEVQAKHDMWLRAVADFDNFRKRTEREIQGILRSANERLILELLDVIDGLELGLSAVNAGGRGTSSGDREGTSNAAEIGAAKPDKSGDSGIVEGLTLVLSKLGKILEAEGVTEIDALGKEFDPLLCEAVMQVSGSGYESHHVAEVMRKGYMLGDKLLRPARVKVEE